MIHIQALDEAIRIAFPGLTHLDIEDMSNGCGESYTVLLVTQEFEGMSTLARHRKINAVLQTQIAQMHAFSQKTFTPSQYKAYLEKSH